MSNLGTMMGLYLGLTGGFFAIKYLKSKSGNFGAVYQMIYLLAVIVLSFTINLRLTYQLCGSNNYSTALLVTLVPWILILGLLTMLLQVFPGWKAPFSNTIGYIVAKALGVGKVLMKMSPEGKGSKLYNLLRKKPSTAVNLHTWPEVKENPLKFNTTGENSKAFEKFKQIVLIKDLIGEMMWYLLSGFLVISYQSSYITNNSCPATIDEGSSEVKPPPEATDQDKTVAKY